MARPKTIKNEDILKVARELFLEKGCDIPTSEIAKSIGISEGSIFKRFSTKEELFAAAMGLERVEWLEKINPLIGKKTVEENIRFLIRSGLDFFIQIVPRLMLTWSKRSGEFKPHSKSGPAKALAVISEYIEGERQLNRVRCQNPEVAARMILAAIANYAFFHTMGIGAKIDQDEYAEQVASTLWRGIAPTENRKEQTTLTP